MRRKKSPQKPYYICHVVSHTHWDRDWYLTFEQFRLRLLAVIDKLLAIMHQDARFRWFVLDGQTVVLEDYLEIKPERKEELKELIKGGRIFIGPLYVQTDEFLVSGEALIRNLLIGSEIARQFGRRMNVGYFPDTFGHIRQMPQILKGFGLDSFIFTRGMGDEVEDLGSEFIWVAPDGESSVLAINQINSYGNVYALGVPFSDPWHFKPEFELAREKTDFEVSTLSKYARTPYLLFNNGVDHYPPQPEIIDLIDYINRQRKGFRLEHSNFERYVARVKRYAPRLKKFTGEFRRGYRHWIISGVYSSRLYLKQENEKAEVLLENLLEPLSVFLWLCGKDYPAEILRHLWKSLLKNHPHDDICGCSIDAVHRDMMVRFDQLQRTASYLLREYKHELLDRIQLRSRDYGEAIVVFNTLPWRRKFIYAQQEVFLPQKLADPEQLFLVNSAGEKIYAEFQLKEIIENKHLWGEEKMQKILVNFFAPEVPAMGFETFYVRSAIENAEYRSQKSEIVPVLKLLKYGMENKFYKITINDDGTLNILDKERGLRMQRTHWFEDTADKGDEYDYSPLPDDKPLTTRGKKADKIELVEAKPHRVIWRISHNWRLPAKLSPDRKARSNVCVQVEIATAVTLWAGKKEIDFSTTVINRAKDHRLRCGFSIPFATRSVFAESKFDVVERPHLTHEEVRRQMRDGWMQPDQPTAPQDRFVIFCNPRQGVGFINLGLPEYEAGSEGNKSYFYLTLLRSIGWLSQGDLLTRKANAGPQIQTPDAQCLGLYEMHYAITSAEFRSQKPEARNKRQEARCKKQEIGRMAMEHNVPLFVAAYENRFRGQQSLPLLPEKFSLIEISPASPVLISALKKAEKRNSVIIRLFNPTDDAETIQLKFGRAPKKTYQARLDEQRQKQLKAPKSSLVTLKIPPRKILTLETEF